MTTLFLMAFVACELCLWLLVFRFGGNGVVAPEEALSVPEATNVNMERVANFSRGEVLENELPEAIGVDVDGLAPIAQRELVEDEREERELKSSETIANDESNASNAVIDISDIYEQRGKEKRK